MMVKDELKREENAVPYKKLSRIPECTWSGENL
jgi:hypothetical protein